MKPWMAAALEAVGRALLIITVCASWYIFGSMEGQNRQWAALVWGCWSAISVLCLMLTLAGDRQRRENLKEQVSKQRETMTKMRRALLRAGGIEPVGTVSPIEAIERLEGRKRPDLRALESPGTVVDMKRGRKGGKR